MRLIKINLTNKADYYLIVGKVFGEVIEKTKIGKNRTP